MTIIALIPAYWRHVQSYYVKPEGGRLPNSRAFLKAAGVSIAQPCLESLGAPRGDAAAPKRMVCISSALGMNPEVFFPKSFGRDYELSPSLEPLAELRNDVTVFPCRISSSPCLKD